MLKMRIRSILWSSSPVIFQCLTFEKSNSPNKTLENNVKCSLWDSFQISILNLLGFQSPWHWVFLCPWQSLFTGAKALFIWMPAVKHVAVAIPGGGQGWTKDKPQSKSATGRQSSFHLFSILLINWHIKLFQRHDYVRHAVNAGFRSFLLKHRLQPHKHYRVSFCELSVKLLDL